MNTSISLNTDEIITEVNDNLRLIESSNGLRFGTDALMLAGFVRRARGGSAIEFGAGSGIISLLCASRGKFDKITAVEVQPLHADIVRRNVALNSLEGKIEAVCADIRELDKYAVSDCVDAIFCNPPYMKTDSGKANACDEKNAARHEVNGTIRDFCLAAQSKLKFGGSFYVVYRPDRLCDLIASMRECLIEPKQITFVAATPKDAPSMVLVRARRGGAPGVDVTRQFFIYANDAHEYSEDMEYLLKYGEFPNICK